MCRILNARSSFALFFFVVFAQLTSSQQLPCPASRLRGRMEAVNPGSAEIGKRIVNNNDIMRELRNIQSEFEKIDKKSNATRCGERQEHGLRNVREVVRALNLVSNTSGEIIDNCVTKVDFPRDNIKKEMTDAKQFSNSLTRFERGFADNAADALRAINANSKLVKSGTFPNPLPVGEVLWSKPSNYHECRIHHANAYRVLGKWYFVAEITNAEVDKKMGEKKRFYYREMFHLHPKNELAHLKVKVKDTCDADSNAAQGTAWVEAWDGEAHFSVYLTGDAEQDALHAVRDEIDGKETDVVMDSDTASNIAILLLPVGLALLPLSLFQDVGTGVTLLYVLFTDIISVLPVAIKGVELIELAAHEHNARTAYVYGSYKSQVVATEMWVSSCKLKDFVRIRGIALLTVAFTSMIVGLILEFVVRHRLEKYKEVTQSYLVKELEIEEERSSLDENRRSSIYSEQVVNFIQRSGGGGLLWHIEQAKAMGKEHERRASLDRASMERATINYRKSLEQTRLVPPQNIALPNPQPNTTPPHPQQPQILNPQQ